MKFLSPLGLGCALLLGGVTGAEAATHRVIFRSNNTFVPAAITINAGDTVVFENQGGSHTVTGTGADPFCGNDAVPQSCSVTFNTPGTFPYRCLFHSSGGANPSGMTGTVTVTGAAEKPNVVPFHLAGWTSPVVVSRAPGTNISDPDVADDQDIWLDWAIANISLTAGITQRFFTEILIDGVSKASWFHDGLPPDTFNKIEDYNLGKLPAGDYVLTLVTDHTGVVDESNEADNVYQTSLRITPTTQNRHVVLVSDFRFNPAFLVVKRGATVDFRNLEGFHTVTGTGADPFCGDQAIQNVCSVTFNTPGRYLYRCVFHSSSPTQGMTGEVLVVDEVVAERAALVEGPYQTAAGADVDYSSRTVTFPAPSGRAYWRLNSSSALRITRIEVTGGNVRLAFE